MPTQDDFLTASKNGVVATNGLNQTWVNMSRKQHGDETSPCGTAAYVAYVGVGRLVTVSVVAAGSDGGFIYDAATVESPKPEARLMAIPKEIGVYSASFKVKNGVTVIPGKDQAVTVTYSTDA